MGGQENEEKIEISAFHTVPEVRNKSVRAPWRLNISHCYPSQLICEKGKKKERKKERKKDIEVLIRPNTSQKQSDHKNGNKNMNITHDSSSNDNDNN